MLRRAAERKPYCRVQDCFPRLRHVPKTGVRNPLHLLGFMTVCRRFLLTPSFARLIRRERGRLRHVEGFFPEQRDRSSWVRLEEGKGLLILQDTWP